MRRIALCMIVLAGMSVGAAHGQQAAPAKSETEPRVTTPAKPQVTRAYRSYSVAPSNRSVVRHRGHASHATWRHADSKAAGQFHSGR